jgi:hypothetical protein
LRPGRTNEAPCGEFVHTAVQEFGFVAVERFPFGNEPIEAFGRNDELSYLFLNQKGNLSPCKRDVW